MSRHDKDMAEQNGDDAIVALLIVAFVAGLSAGLWAAPIVIQWLLS